MKHTLTIEARRFPVTVKDSSGEVTADTITISKQELQAAQLVGQSSKELISRLYWRKGFKVLDIGKPERRTLQFSLSHMWDMEEFAERAEKQEVEA